MDISKLTEVQGLIGLASRLELSDDIQQRVREFVLSHLGCEVISNSQNRDMRIRALVEKKSSWKILEPELMLWIKEAKNSHSITRCIELAVLYDNKKNIPEWFHLGSSYGPKLFSEMHERVRAKLVTEHFLDEHGKLMASILEPVMNEAWLILPERLLLYKNILMDKRRAYTYFCQHEIDLVSAIQMYSRAIDYPSGAFYVATARVLLEAGDNSKVRDILKNIPVSDSAFNDALKILRNIDSDERSLLDSQAAKAIFSHPDWEARLAVFESYLDQIRSALPEYHDATPTLNHLAVKPFSLVGDRPEAISEFAEVCLSAFDLLGRIPNLEGIFRSNALQFHNATLDGSIWHPVMRATLKNEKVDFWRAVALVHRFVSGGQKYEENLLFAWRIFKIQKECQKNYSFNWDQLLDAAAKSIRSSTVFSEPEKKVMEVQLSISKTPDQITSSQMAEYFDVVPNKNYEVIKFFNAQSKFQGTESFNLTLLRMLGQSVWYRNQDIERMWYVAKENKMNDLMWRAASVANFRQFMNRNLVASWSVSGENRSLYSVPNIQKSHATYFLFDLSHFQKKLCISILNLEGRIRDLLPEVDKSLKAYKWKATSARDIRLTHALEALSWLGPIKKRYSSLTRVEAGPLAPFFAEAVPVNDWADSLGWLGEATGITYIFNRVDEIIKISEQVNMQLQPRPETKLESPSVKWVKSLDYTHRAAWYEFVESLKKLSSREIEDALSVMLVRIASLLFANHTRALQSLVEMGASLTLIRSLENWILSEELSKLRLIYGVDSKLILPEFMQLDALGEKPG
ncbi:MAG: hypothetical protein WCI18_12985 [Pseudomonadota bacterium]